MMRDYTITVRSTEPGWADAKRRAAIVTDREIWDRTRTVQFAKARTFTEGDERCIALTFREQIAPSPDAAARAADEEREGTA